MAALKACNILITGANRGLGLEMVKQLAEMPCSNRQIFACSREPDSPKSEALRELTKKHPNIIKTICLDVTNPVSIKEAAKKVGALTGKTGLNLLVNNAGLAKLGSTQNTTAEDMLAVFNTNVMGPFSVTQEFLPYLQTAAKASGTPGLSCNKAAVINISSSLGSMTCFHEIYNIIQAFPYCVSKASLNMMTVLSAHDCKSDGILFAALHPGWVKTDMGGDQALIEAKESVAGMLHVMSTLTEKQTGVYLDYTGKTIPW
ncbi:uncharacterized protein LOC115826403 [Chanos chanos]|uniref:Uncharacterized protein LOC115826403 n=1 Tax=Chanos chanos TaxID=29144 RepID=A0A6J2WP59_CHACN|nr:uncharacterized protein LOC115826403 [Chanos chanos]